jgi:hypothetical protein
VVALASLAAPLLADVSGVVLDQDSNPIVGAQVRLQATSAPVATTGPGGAFTLTTSFSGTRTLAASLPYAAGAPPHFNTEGTDVADGATGVTVLLPRIPATSQTTFGILNLPDAAFCGNCHSSQQAQWATSNHAGAARDAWVMDLFSGTGTPGGANGYVYKTSHDPGETGFCATCHISLADVTNPGNVLLDDPAFESPVVMDGVGCLACHKIDNVNGANLNALHLLGKTSYRFPDDLGTSWPFVWGPLPDVVSTMRNSEAAIYRDSLYCASCHQYTNPTTGAPGQNTYVEWQASPYAVPGPGFRSCQDCHMPGAATPGPLVAGGDVIRPGSQRHDHSFVGATPTTLASAITLSANGAEVGGVVQVNASVTNNAGHAFPTGISIRNAMVLISASYQGTPLVQTSGPTIPFWADDDVPGQQPGDHANKPGKGFAKVTEGRINGTGPVVRPTLFIDAEALYSNTLIPSSTTDATTVTFALPPGAQPGAKVDVDVKLLYRRAWRALAVTKGWTLTPQGGPVEIQVAHLNFPVELTTPVELQSLEIE